MDVYGLIGNPVGHSLSPPMHEAAYDALGMDARYVTFEPDRGAAAAAVEGAAALGVAGLNVTIPFKRDVLDAVEPDPLAARVGAVNTVDLGHDPPRGYNTDVAGVRRALSHHGVDPAGESTVVVGAGGAGRAAAFALADAGADVHVANRTVERAESLAAAVRGDDGGGSGEGGGGGGNGSRDGGGSRDGDGGRDENGERATDGARVAVTAGGLETLAERVPAADVLVNATSVGMESDETPVPAELLHADLAVLDAVYTPLETRLLREAAAAGATTVDGAWMLLYQGVEAFERWTGRDAPVEPMDAALRSRL
jgi:shikimate dehydrogenase